MAELILSPIADKILGGLGSAAVKEIALLWGVNDDLDQLNETISTIKSVLLDAEEKQINSHQVRNWLRRLGGVVDDADNLMDEFNTEALRRRVMPLVNNGRLRSLLLSGSHKLASLPEGLQHLTSLRFLWITDWKNLETIPEWIGNLNSLETLKLGKCPKLRALPEGVRSLTCLKTLDLEDCSELRALPEGIRSLTCLKSLMIWDCPMLLKRYQSPIGEDWPKIAHIPRLDLGLDPNRNDDAENPTRDEHTTSLDKIKACSSSFLFKNFGLCMQ